MKEERKDPTATREAELIGAIVLWPETYDAVPSGLVESDFTDSGLGKIWRTIRDRASKGLSIDAASVVAELPNDLADLLVEATSMTGTGAYVEHHANGILRSAVHRRLRGALQSINEEDPETAIAVARRVIDESEDRLGHAGGDEVFDDTAKRMTIVIEAAQEARSTGFSGYRTGVRLLDRLTGGLRPGTTWIIGARPSTGKSALATQIANYVASSGAHVVYVSMEMQVVEIAKREVAGETGINLLKLTQGKMADEEWANVTRTANALVQSPGDKLLMTDRLSTDAEVVISTLRRLKRQGRLDVLIVDYIQKLYARKLVGKSASRTNEVEVICGMFAAFARENRCSSILLSQLSRGGSTESRPGLARLRDSGAIEADGDVIVLMWRPEEDEPEREVIVAKNRQGPTASEHLYFDEKRLRFYEIASDQREPAH